MDKIKLGRVQESSLIGRQAGRHMSAVVKKTGQGMGKQRFYPVDRLE